MRLVYDETNLKQGAHIHQLTAWPVRHACAQPYYPGSCSRGQAVSSLLGLISIEMVLKDRRYCYMLFICLFTYLFFQSRLFVKHLIEGKEMEGRVVLRYSWTLREFSSFLAKKCRFHGLFLPMNERALRPSFHIITQITSIAQGISNVLRWSRR